eukprot:90003-Rhodomonas_salina.2
MLCSPQARPGQRPGKGHPSSAGRNRPTAWSQHILCEDLVSQKGASAGRELTGSASSSGGRHQRHQGSPEPLL